MAWDTYTEEHVEAIEDDLARILNAGEALTDLEIWIKVEHRHQRLTDAEHTAVLDLIDTARVGLITGKRHTADARNRADPTADTHLPLTTDQ